MTPPRLHALISALVALPMVLGPAAAQEAIPVLPADSLDHEVAPEGSPGSDTFRRLAARRLGTRPDDADLRLDRIEGPVSFPETGVRLFVASAELGDGPKVTLALDADGREVDLERARLDERLLARQRRGKLSRALFDEVAAEPARRRTVAVWVDVPEVEDLGMLHSQTIADLEDAGLATTSRVEEHQEWHAAQVSERIGTATRDLADAFRGAGLQVLGASDHAPLVFVSADADELARLTTDGRVLALDDAAVEHGPRLDISFDAVQADRLYTTWPSADAKSTKVAVVESGKPCTTQFLSVAATRKAGSASAHATGVASCIASSHSSVRGIAQGAKIYAANGATALPGSVYTWSFQPSVDAVAWALQKGCQVMNLSYGAGEPTANVSAFDRYLDYVARTYRRTMVVACGNSGNFAGDPGAGYNQIAVGNYNAGGTSSWSNDTMSTGSSWQNPATGVETPQIAAPGNSIQMLDCSGGTSYTQTGTSFSAPMVAGAAALLIDRQPGLGSSPEAVRAILMATAWNNIEGAAGLSSQDGAGGLDARAAYRVAVRGKGSGYQYGTLYSSSFNKSKEKTVMSAYIPAGQAVRVCLSWNAKVGKHSTFLWSGMVPYSVTYHSSELVSDLDLRVYRNGTLVASSSSSVNPFEMATFKAKSSGFYQVRVRKSSFGSSSEPYGVAVSMSSDI